MYQKRWGVLSGFCYLFDEVFATVKGSYEMIEYSTTMESPSRYALYPSRLDIIVASMIASNYYYINAWATDGKEKLVKVAKGIIDEIDRQVKDD